MDGANEVTMFFRILIPVAMPVFACILLFDAVSHWNSYYDCMLYTKSDNLVVLSYKFAKMLLSQQYLDVVAADPNLMSPEELMMARGPVSSLTLQMATMVVTVVPIICVYPFLQKIFREGPDGGFAEGLKRRIFPLSGRMKNAEVFAFAFFPKYVHGFPRVREATA